MMAITIAITIEITIAIEIEIFAIDFGNSNRRSFLDMK
jgi:hypothetical protein